MYLLTLSYLISKGVSYDDGGGFSWKPQVLAEGSEMPAKTWRLWPLVSSLGACGVGLLSTFAGDFTHDAGHLRNCKLWGKLLSMPRPVLSPVASALGRDCLWGGPWWWEGSVSLSAWNVWPTGSVECSISPFSGKELSWAVVSPDILEIGQEAFRFTWRLARESSQLMMKSSDPSEPVPTL